MKMGGEVALTTCRPKPESNNMIPHDSIDETLRLEESTETRRKPIQPKRVPLSGGWVKLWRGLLEHSILTNVHHLQLLIWCMLRANYKLSQVNGHALRRGQFWCGRKATAEQLETTEARIRSGLKSLAEHGLIETLGLRDGTIVTVKVYDRALTGCEDSYVQLQHELLNADLIAFPELLQVFVWCLLRASFKPHETQGKHLDPGMLLIGERTSPNELGLTRSVFDERLRELDRLKWIKIHDSERPRVVEVVDWEIEQDSGPQKAPTAHQLSDQQSASGSPAESQAVRHRERRGSRESGKAEKNENPTSPSPSPENDRNTKQRGKVGSREASEAGQPAILESGNPESEPESVVVGRIVDRLRPFVDLDPRRLALDALKIHPPDRIHRFIDHFEAYREGWDTAGVLVTRLRNPLDDLDRGWPPLSEKFQHKLNENRRRQAEQRRQREEAEAAALEKQRRDEEFKAETARLELRFGAKLDAMSEPEILQLTRGDSILKRICMGKAPQRCQLLRVLERAES